jgi:hypothetical protein
LPKTLTRPSPAKPLALLVLLENVGHVAGLPLPKLAMSAIDYITEEYAKLLLRLCGAYLHYDNVTILEDAHATGSNLAGAILRLSRSHRVDLLLLVHGKEGSLVGYRGQELIGRETFDLLLEKRRNHPAAVDLRMVFGLNCYGASLLDVWMQLGATVANGTPGVNWLPEPSLSVFLRNWFSGQPYAVAIQRSNRRARRWGGRVWRCAIPGKEHAKIESSRQIVYGARDVTIHSRA